MSRKSERENQIQILNILYARLMRLNFSHRMLFMYLYFSGPLGEYNNLLYFWKLSFATDAYTTINALLDSGTMSFCSLGKNNSEISNAIKESRRFITKQIPNYKDYRNKVFCHINQPITKEATDAILIHFNAIFNYLVSLHMKCMTILGINVGELQTYNADDFKQIEQEFENLQKSLSNISTKQIDELRKQLQLFIESDETSE